MAKKVRRVIKKKKVETIWKFPLEKQNFVILGIGLAVIVIGYLLMSTGISEDAATIDGTWNNPLAVDIAPLLLVLGYCVIIPVGLLKNFRTEEQRKDPVE